MPVALLPYVSIALLLTHAMMRKKYSIAPPFPNRSISYDSDLDLESKKAKRGQAYIQTPH